MRNRRHDTVWRVLLDGSGGQAQAYLLDQRIWLSSVDPVDHEREIVIRPTDLLVPLRGSPFHCAVERAGHLIGWTLTPFGPHGTKHYREFENRRRPETDRLE